MPKPVTNKSRGVRPRRNAELPAPTGLEAATFSVEDDEYAILSFPLPEVRIPAGLTAAEAEVVRWALDGRSNAEIARQRKTSSNTVANQLRSVYAKLQLSGRGELAQHCVEPALCRKKQHERRPR
jgi:DNA-binding CsgD family transcriptional regulator